MIDSEKPNPFQVLGLSTSATNKEIVERGRELYDTAETDEQRQLYRWAKEQLLTQTQMRLVYELFEAPDAQYEHSGLIENFLRKYERNPVSPGKLMTDTPAISIEDFNVDALIRLLLQDILRVPEGDIRVAIQHAPFRPAISPLEVRDVLFG